MAFLHRLTDEQQAAKKLKQDELKKDLYIQVQAKQARLHILQQQKLEEDNKEYALEMAARGLDASLPAKGRRRAAKPQRQQTQPQTQNHTVSPLRGNQNHNNSTIFSPSVPVKRTGFGRPKPFLATLNALHGQTIDNDSKQRARDAFRAQLTAQVQEKEYKDALRTHNEKVREARDLQVLINKGLDFWGNPLPPGATPVKIPTRLLPFLEGGSANAPSPSAPAAVFARASSPSPVSSPASHAPEQEQEPYDQRYDDEPHPEQHAARGGTRPDSTSSMTSMSSTESTRQLAELTDLCHRLVAEQKRLRATVEQQQEQLAATTTSSRASGGRPRRRRPRKNENETTVPQKENATHNARNGATRRLAKSKSSGGAAFGSSTSRMIAREGVSHRKENRGRNRGRTTTGKSNTKHAIRSMAPTKQEKEDAKQRRIAVREKYAKRTRYVPKGKQEVDSPTRQQRGEREPGHHHHPHHPQHPQPQQYPPEAPPQQQQQPAWEDNRPIRPTKGSVPTRHRLDGGPATRRLDGDSQFVTGYDRKRNPLNVLASGLTPRRSQLKDSLDRAVGQQQQQFVAKKYRPPKETFSFDPDPVE
jgi:hypothetical protein